MKNLINYILILFVITLFASCLKSDLNKHEPIEKEGDKPPMVTDVKVVNGAGSAIISYTLPKSDDLQYVMAKYSINNNTVREAKSSRYGDTINVDGFHKEGEYIVELYSVSRSEVKSDPVFVIVNPTLPNYKAIANSMVLNVDFGGVNVSFNNPDEDKIAVVVITKDHNDELMPTETFYTQVKDGSFSVRGYEVEPRVFGAYIKDRWNNHSDTIYKEVTPMFERALDKSKFKSLLLLGDQPHSPAAWNMTNLWDNKLGEPGFHTLPGSLPRPHRFTFDMGVVAKLSRFKILQRKGIYFYSHGNAKEFIVYGSETMPDASGSMDNWIKLAHCNSVKPSELPLGQVTEDDKTYAIGADGLGEEFLIPIAAPAVRYIRMEILQNWTGTDFFHALELTFWGNPNNL